MRSPLAICCRMSALGLRRPRSIWLRYGLGTPAFWASWRIEIFACSRCSLMYSPMELTLTLRILQVCHRALAIANAQQAPGNGGENATPLGNRDINPQITPTVGYGGRGG